jgi:ABC-type transporter Mla MlaB component
MAQGTLADTGDDTCIVAIQLSDCGGGRVREAVPGLDTAAASMGDGGTRMIALAQPQLRISVTDDPPGLTVAGEVDMSVRNVWQDALDSVVGQDMDVHLELSRLRFIDACGTSYLMHASRRMPAGRHVIVHNPCTAFRRISELAWPNVPTIKVVAS